MRVIDTGILGSTEGFYWTTNPPANNDIDIDNDGEYANPHYYMIDLSKVASNALGRQASMMAGYKLHSVSVQVCPVDDANDNDVAAAFAGSHFYRLMTPHMKKALQLARKTEKYDEASQVDGDSFFLSGDRDYRGFRYTWGPEVQFEVLEHATASTMLSANYWNLVDICNNYDSMTAPSESNALFNGRAPDVCDLMWQAGWANKPWDSQSTIGEHRRSANIEIVPILAGHVRWTSVDEPQADFIDDDYIVRIEVDFTIQEAF